MTTLLTRIQLTVFAVVTVLAVSYGAVSFFNIGAVVRPPFEVRAQFETSGGIYPRADVDLLGTRDHPGPRHRDHGGDGDRPRREDPQGRHGDDRQQVGHR